MKDYAIAISVYDKFQDVRLLIDLIRDNWPGDYFIAVCSSHPDPFSHLADCRIDRLITIDGFALEGEKITDSRVAPRARLWARVIDSIRKVSSLCALESQSDYTVHIHADAAPLSWPKLKLISDTMKEKQKYVAARGEGFGIYTPNEPLGGFDDMFVVFDNVFAKSSGLWDIDVFDLMPHKISIHGLLAILGLTRIGAKHFYHYTDHTEAIYWDGKPVVLYPLNSAHPMYFDPHYDFLHIHETGFLNNLGLHLKAYYFDKFGITKGTSIKTFLKEWLIPKDKLFQDLEKMEESLHSFFISKGLSSAPYGRNFDHMELIQRGYEALESSEKRKWLISMHVKQFKDWAAKFGRGLFTRPNHRSQRYSDMFWPDNLDQLYAQIFSETPEKLRNFSFEHGGIK